MMRSKPLVPPDACSFAIASSFELKTVTVTFPNLSSSSCEWYSAQVNRLRLWLPPPPPEVPPEPLVPRRCRCRRRRTRRAHPGRRRDRPVPLRPCRANAVASGRCPADGHWQAEPGCGSGHRPRSSPRSIVVGWVDGERCRMDRVRPPGPRSRRWTDLPRRPAPGRCPNGTTRRPRDPGGAPRASAAG